MSIITKENLEEHAKWGEDFFYFAEHVLNLRPADPLDSLLGKVFEYKVDGEKRQAILFDHRGRLIHHNLRLYKRAMFKNQNPEDFTDDGEHTRFTWQQTVIFEAYNRALQTFGKDSYDAIARFISIVSGHGIGKTSSMAMISLHFLSSFFGAQGLVTANTENQIKTVFMKEFFIWEKKLPKWFQGNFEQLDDMIRVEKDWFIKAAVANKDTPESIAGLHAPYILLMFDEASAIHKNIWDVVEGALTGRKFIFMTISNGTRAEGEFYDCHHRLKHAHTTLSFSSRHSPIASPNFIERIETKNPPNGDRPSDEVIIRIDGGFPSTTEMDDKGWIPLFSNVKINFEPGGMQKFGPCVGAVDPSGKGRDSTIGGVRDSVYLKEVFNEKISNPKSIARKSETMMDVYKMVASDLAIDAFGEGAKTVAEINTKVGESVVALLLDKPREETKHLYKTLNDELAWKFKNWVAAGGIIITNDPAAWEKELSKIKYRRIGPGLIQIQGKVEFKKENGFSPDRFDMAKMTFHKKEGYVKPELSKEELETKEIAEYIARRQSTATEDEYSSM